MNFSISKSEFYEALQKVVGVVPQKTTISILTCILMELDGDELRLTGTDLEISVTHSLKVDATEGGSVAVPAKLLLEIVRELPNVPVNLVSDSGDKVVLSTDKGEYKIATQPKEDFPNINVEEGEYSLELDGNLLARLTNKTIFAVSTDELRPALTGINFEIADGNLIFVGTDGHRLSKVVQAGIDLPATDTHVKMILPTKALNLVIKNLDTEKPVAIQIGEDHVVFTLADAVIYSKLINGAYPNYERVLPQNNEKLLTVNRELLVSSLRRVSIFSSSLTNQVRLVITPDELTTYSEDIEFGAEAKEAIPAHYTDEWLQIGYNSAYLLDILKHLEGEEIVFELSDNASAAIIRPAEQKDNETVTMLLMPIRINEEQGAEG